MTDIATRASPAKPVCPVKQHLNTSPGSNAGVITAWLDVMPHDRFRKGCLMFTKLLLTSLIVAGALATGTSHAQTQQQTPEGLNYVTGGVTVGDLQAMKNEKDRYSLWLTTAAKGSGAFLSDADVKITNARTNEVVLPTTMEGPWVFVKVPAGTYTIETKFMDQVQSRKTRIDKGDHHQAIMYFDNPAKLSPDRVSPFAKSPYASNE